MAPNLPRTPGPLHGLPPGRRPHRAGQSAPRGHLLDVDGRTVTELGTRVDCGRQEVRVDGMAIHRPRLVHYMLNKPAGWLTASWDLN